MPAPSGNSDNVISGRWANPSKSEKNTEKNDLINVRNLSYQEEHCQIYALAMRLQFVKLVTQKLTMVI